MGGDVAVHAAPPPSSMSPASARVCVPYGSLYVHAKLWQNFQVRSGRSLNISPGAKTVPQSPIQYLGEEFDTLEPSSPFQVTLATS